MKLFSCHYYNGYFSICLRVADYGMLSKSYCVLYWCSKVFRNTALSKFNLSPNHKSIKRWHIFIIFIMCLRLDRRCKKDHVEQQSWLRNRDFCRSSLEISVANQSVAKILVITIWKHFKYDICLIYSHFM